MSVNTRVYSVARVYADANSNRPTEYWDYETHKIENGVKLKIMKLSVK